MAINPQIPGQAIAQPAPAFIDTFPKGPNFGSEFNGRESSIDPAKAFTNYLGRVHKKYNDMDTANIENLVNRLLQEQEQTFLNFVREETSLRDTFINRLFEAKTPLGEVLQELQNSQESPNRKLLSKEIFNKAEKEAIELTKKEVALTTKKRGQREVSNEISHLLKKQTTVNKIGPEFQVSTYTANDQKLSSVVSLSNSTFVVTWQSGYQDGDRNGIYGQIFNADGTKSGSEFQINTYTIDNQQRSSTTALSNDKFVVTWDSYLQDGSGNDIYGQAFNADGTKSGSEFQINTYIFSNQVFPSVASLSNGKFVVTWTSLDQDGDLYGVYGQIFNADGTKSGSEFQINTYTTSLQMYSSVASLSNDKFVVTWQSDGQDGSLNGVYGQIFNADGTKSGSEFQVNTYTINWQWRPSVASLSNGKFVVTWTSDGQDGDSNGVYGQAFNADGTKSGSEFQVNTYTISSQEWPSVASLSNGKFVVTWRSYFQDGSWYGVYGQIFNADGTKNGFEFQVNTYTTSNQQVPSVARLNNDEFVVTWSSYGQDGAEYGIYGQIFEVIIPTSSSISSTTSSTSSSTGSSLLPSFTSSSTGSSLLPSFTSSSTSSSLLPSSTSSSTSSSLLPSSTSSNSLSTKNVQNISTSENQYTSSSNNKRLITWLAVSIIGCLGSSSLLGYLYFRKRKNNQQPTTTASLSLGNPKPMHETFELERQVPSENDFVLNFPGASPEMVLSGTNQQYQLTPIAPEVTPEMVRSGMNEQYQLTPNVPQDGVAPEIARSETNQHYQLTPNAPRGEVSSEMASSDQDQHYQLTPDFS